MSEYMSRIHALERIDAFSVTIDDSVLDLDVLQRKFTTLLRLDDAFEEIVYLQAYINVAKNLYAASPSNSPWITMQSRWVIWTLASWERSFPHKHLTMLFRGYHILYAILWRCKAYFRSQFAHLPPLPHSIYKSRNCRVSAEEHFARNGSMSPLQRCCDIREFLWPMTLCFSARKTTSPSGSVSLSSPAAASVPWHFEASDGWWWTAVSLDADLTSLVERVCYLRTPY